MNQRLAARLLEKRGCTVKLARTGGEAVAAMRQEAFDLVLMDLQMPEMGGVEATAAIRDAEASSGIRTPIIALTAHAIKGDREKCLESAMDGYVAKPVRTEELFDEIERVLRRCGRDLAAGGKTRGG